MTILTHKMEIKPNKTCINLIEQYFGYSRYCYNRALDVWNKEYLKGNKPTGRKVRDIIRPNKEEWESKLSAQMADCAIEDLEHGYLLFFKKVSKNKPHFKSKKKSKQTFRVNRRNESSIRIKDNKLFLPKFPYGIKMTEKIRFNGTIKQCTISKKANRYFASFVIDITDSFDQVKGNLSCGIDLGIKEFAIVGYGNRRFKHYKGCYKRIKPLYEQISHYHKVLSRKQKDSNKYNVVRTKLQRLYLKISNIQKDYLNKLTTKLCKAFKTITIEDLNVKGMLKNKHLSEKISKSLFYTFRCMLEYKSKLYGNTIIIADRWFPSTQKCSHCGYIRTKEEKLKLSDRIHTCPSCGVIDDRDENAAYNLKLYGDVQVGLQP